MKYVLVTGANRGIGLAVVKELSLREWKVYAGVRDLVRAELTLKNIPNVEIVKMDVADNSSVENAIKNITKLDVLINNAGINYDTWQTATNADEKNIKETFETNFFGAWRVIKNCLPLLEQSKDARIVNISSGLGSIHSMGGGTPGYSTSKAALNALTKIFSSELKSKNILVNSVCPGWIATDMGGAGGAPVEVGVKSVLWAVDIPNHGPTGGFFQNGKQLDW